MHFGLSGFGVMSRNIQQFELINIVVFIVLSYHIAGATGATDYCSLCKPNQQHVACNNNGVCLHTSVVGNILQKSN